MRAQSSILELVKIDRSWPLHGLTCTREQYRAEQLWPLRISPTRPQEFIDLEELLSELITMARMPRIKTGQCYADLWGTLPYPV